MNTEIADLKANPQLERLGFTLIEMMLGAAIFVIALTAFIGGFFGQAYLNANARNLMAAMNDATRVMEQIRQQNAGTVGTCGATGVPSTTPPAPFTSWEAWLANQGKTLRELNLLAVTCQDGSSTAAATAYCGPNQMGAGEWKAAPSNTSFDPIRVTVAVAWRQGRRAMGADGAWTDFSYNPARTRQSCIGGGCVPQTCTSVQVPESLQVRGDQDGDGAVEAPAMLMTLITCRK